MKRRPTEPRMRTVVRLLALLCKRIESIGRAASCDRDAYHLRTTDMPKCTDDRRLLRFQM